MKLTPQQKRVCEQVVNVFETGRVAGDYGAIARYADGPHGIRQVTYGRSQTTEYGKLDDLVDAYVKNAGQFAAPLKPYVPKIGVIPLVDDAAFLDLLRKAAQDPVMQQTQDAFFDARYFQPALDWATDNGFVQPLSALVIYDSFIHSGSILGFLRKRFATRVPANGGAEKEWTANYVAARLEWLRTHSNELLRKTVYRPKCFQAQIASNNWDLAQLPIIANGIAVPG